MKDIFEIARSVKSASATASLYSEAQRNQAILNIAKALIENKQKIAEENKTDIDRAIQSKLSPAMIDRLVLNEERIENLASSVQSIAEQEAVVGKIVSESTRPNGLKVSKKRIPLGVIGIIFESRPGVVIDCAALAIKSGNGVLLKGGKEAAQTNTILGKIVKEAISNDINPDLIEVLDSTNREDIDKLLGMKEQIDLVIPRGGEGLIRHVHANAKMPVIAHFKGLCHTYIDKDADENKAIAIAVNAKLQRPGVCNSMETLLIHQDLSSDFRSRLFKELHLGGAELRLDSKLYIQYPQYQEATEDDWQTEYLSSTLSVRMVSSLDEAIAHIREYGSGHTESIVSESRAAIDTFINSIDSSCVTVNASSRFNDGGQLGLGAELGISTTKFHAYGPMGAEEMTTTHFIVEGTGQIR